jgi:hypothetical protein
MKTLAGSQFDFLKSNTLDDTTEQREPSFENLWQNGDFEFWLPTHEVMPFSDAANSEAYNFWAKQTRTHISDPQKFGILAALEPIHPFSTNRPRLKQDFYK